MILAFILSSKYCHSTLISFSLAQKLRRSSLCVRGIETEMFAVFKSKAEVVHSLSVSEHRQDGGFCTRGNPGGGHSVCSAAIRERSIFPWLLPLHERLKTLIVCGPLELHFDPTCKAAWSSVTVKFRLLLLSDLEGEIRHPPWNVTVAELLHITRQGGKKQAVKEVELKYGLGVPPACWPRAAGTSSCPT